MYRKCELTQFMTVVVWRTVGLVRSVQRLMISHPERRLFVVWVLCIPAQSVGWRRHISFSWYRWITHDFHTHMHTQVRKRFSNLALITTKCSRLCRIANDLSFVCWSFVPVALIIHKNHDINSPRSRRTKICWRSGSIYWHRYVLSVQFLISKWCDHNRGTGLEQVYLGLM